MERFDNGGIPAYYARPRVSSLADAATASLIRNDHAHRTGNSHRTRPGGRAGPLLRLAQQRGAFGSAGGRAALRRGFCQ